MKQNRMYNLLFPTATLLFLPISWLVVLPANFIIDSLVLIITMRVLHISIRQWYFKTIWKVWLLGFAADAIGAGVVTGFMMTGWRCIWGVLLAALLIYWFNRYISFRKTDFDDRQKAILSAWLAFITAPYTFFIPIWWFQ